MLCPSCGGETPEGKRFCANCGSALEAPGCGRCGAKLISGKAFCADCGAPVVGFAAGATATIAPPPLEQVPVAERRLCSVLFVDLVGFTPLSERRDPEEIRDLLSVYFERAQTIVGHYGGTVEKFIGDAVMAVWGAPLANEDDAERAVRAGLDMVASVAELGAQSQIPELAARGGVVTGEVAITIGKVAEGMVLGDAVNSAARVQSVAEPGTVLVDEATWRAAQGAIAFAEIGELTLKGKQETVHAWQALRVVAQRKGVGRSEGLEPPFVGRDTELRFIKDLLHATMLERRARLVSVTGVPGIGKSRLAWEFLKYVDGLAETVYWHRGRSPAYGEGVTFWALGEMVRERAGINEAEEPQSARNKIAAAVAEFVTDPEERRWLEPRLFHLLGMADVPQGDREELFSAWRTFFERVAEAGPSVMVFEDLQWADPGLVDFVESILEWSRNHPILVITLARPELADRRPTWGAGQRSFTALHLEPLGEQAMRALLDGLVTDLPADVADNVLGRSEGVPLYAVEMVRALVDRGVLGEEGGRYAVVGDLTAFELPETLHSLIGARLDALPPEQRTLLQDAAVFGSRFSADSLAEIQGIERVKLDADLRDLVRKEFLVLDTDPRSPERGQYGFVQSLIQEVARARLARRDRSAKHLAVARFLAARDDEELAAAVAAHYVEAFRAAPDSAEAGRVSTDAVAWLSRAGRRAESLGSPEQALSFFDQALEMTPVGRSRAELLQLAGAAGNSAGALTRATALFEEAIDYYRAEGDVGATARCTVDLAESLMAARRFDELVARVDAFLEAGHDLEDTVRADLSAMVAGAYVMSGRPETALSWSETALLLAERQDDRSLLARCLGAKSGALYQMGRHREAQILARGMAQLADEAGAQREKERALTSLSVYLLEDDLRGSLTASREAAELARRIGMRQEEVLNLLNAAESSVYVGDWGYTRRALDELSERDLSSEYHAWLRAVEAVLHACTGDASRALALIEANTEYVSSTEFVHARSTHLGAEATVLLAVGDLEASRDRAAAGVAADPMGINASFCLSVQARASLWLSDAAGAREALAALESFRGRGAAATRATVEAGLAALGGDLDRASTRYEAAFDAWEPLDCPLDLALSVLDAEILLGGADLVPTGRDARTLLTELGATAFLRWVRSPAGASRPAGTT